MADTAIIDNAKINAFTVDMSAAFHELEKIPWQYSHPISPIVNTGSYGFLFMETYWFWNKQLIPTINTNV